jgi:hypothetical protein
MKRIIAVSSLLALVLAGSGLFAFDILDSEGEKTGLSIDFEVKYNFEIDTTESGNKSNGDSWVQENDADNQSKAKVVIGYAGDNYEFGTGFGAEKNFAYTENNFAKAATANDESIEFYLDDAWGKFYFLDKQLWLRAGGLEGPWHHGTDPDDGNYADGDKGLQFNFSPAAVSGLKVGFTLPVPGPGTRDGSAGGGTASDNWSPSYIFSNMVFGLKLDNTIPNFIWGSELHLKGMDAATEEKFQGMDTRFGIQYTFSPVTLKAVVKIEEIANSNDYDPLIALVGARLIFALPAVADNLSLGSPWVQAKFESQDKDKTGTDIARADREAFTKTDIAFEWEPSYKIIPDSLTFKFWLGVGYTVYADPTPAQEDYPLAFSVRPGLQVSFAPNASFTVRDRIHFAQQEVEKGVKNTLQFLCELSF